jgi:hypothetical protein
MSMRALLRSFIFVAVLSAPLAAQWDKTPTSVAWTANGRDVWRFSFDPKFGKPFFHPLTVAAGQSFTNFKPEDHPWHYAHWFSWKYINHVNYWEEDRISGQAAGRTRWDTPEIATRSDGSATIKMHLTYTRPTGEVDMTVDRTPLLGEPNGAVNGGYAGLSMRLAAAPVMMSIMTSNGAVSAYEHDRARPGAPAVAGNFTLDGKDLGGVAVLSDPANAGQEAPWYIINVPTDFRFIDAAILAPAIRTIPAHGTFSLRYRVSLKGSAWSQQELVNALNRWK